MFYRKHNKPNKDTQDSMDHFSIHSDCSNESL